MLLNTAQGSRFILRPCFGRGSFKRPSERGLERVSECNLRRLEQVPVCVTRPADRAVSEVRLHLFHVATVRDENRRACVAQIVRSDR